jgi:superfamily I DNA and/or RNA helicase
MSEHQQTHRISPQTTLASYATVTPDAYQKYLSLFLADEEEATIRSTLNRIEGSTLVQLRRNDRIPLFAPSECRPISDTSIAIFYVDPGDDDPGPEYIRQTYGIGDRHEVAVLCTPNEGDDFDVYRGTVEDTSSTSLKTGFDIENRDRSTVRNALETASALNIAGVYDPLVFERERDALRDISRRSALWDVVTGQRPVTFGADDAAKSEALDKAIYENEKQAIAIDQALQADDVYCIQGPPGTGKTRFIVELVRRLVAAGNRVLVTAETNTAVDNILMGSGDRPDDNSLLAYSQAHGRSSKELIIARHNQRRSKRSFIRNKVGQSVWGADVVGSTNNSSSKLIEHGPEFDILVTDEAGQARKTSGFIPLQQVNRAIFVGDHKQLPATRQSKLYAADDHRHRSVFEHLYAGLYPEAIGTRFDTQYRMVPDLIEFSSKTFYDGAIQTGATHESVMSQPIGLIDLTIANGEERVETSRQNQYESTAVAAQVKNLLECYFDPDEIGVIAAYGAQADLIQTQLKTLPVDGADDVLVATIDRFQGSEKEAVVVSFTRSNTDGNIGFLSEDDGPQRLNVALTRARQYCALVGDWDTLRAGDQLYQELYQSVSDRFEIKRYDRETLNRLNDRLT